MKTSGSSSSGWLSKLLEALGLGAVVWNKFKDFFKKKIKEWASKTFKKVLSHAWRGIKTAFGKIWTGLKWLFGKIWTGVKTIASKIWNSKFVKNIRSGLANAWGKIKGVFSSIKNKIVGFFKKIGSHISGLWGKITNSKAYKAFSGIIDDAIAAIKGFFEGIKNKLLSVAKTVTKSVTETLSKAIPGGVKTAASKAGSFIKGVASKAGSTLKTGANAVGKGVVTGANAVGKGVVTGAKAVGKGFMSIGDAALSPIKNTIKGAASGLVKSSGGIMKVMGKFAKRVPIIGPLIEGLMAGYDIKNMKEQHAKGKLSLEDLQQNAGKRIISGVTGMAGASIGAIAGTLIPVPVVGTLIGAVGGDIAGRFIGDLLSKYVIAPKYTRGIGAYATGTTPPKDEMQDFIIKDGRIHKFSKKDEVMGIKTGGAINNFLRGGGNNGIKVLAFYHKKSNEYLAAIAQNTSIMARNGSPSGGSAPIINNVSQSSPQSSKQMMTIPNNRDGYMSSAYSLG
jgi:hypothetical protein